MKIYAPVIGVEKEANIEIIASTLKGISNKKVDGFAILSTDDDLTYIQALWNKESFIVEFQEGSVAKHYRFDGLMSLSQATSLFESYISGSSSWNQGMSCRVVKTLGFWHGLGYSLGSFFGNLARGFNESRKRRDK